MNIWIDSYQLAQDGREGVSGLRIKARRSVQEMSRLRAEYAALADRGNKLHDISFTVAKEYANEAAAELAAISMVDAVPDEGDLKLQSKQGVTTTERFFHNAQVQVSDIQVMGVTLFISFHIIGAKLLTQAELDAL